MLTIKSQRTERKKNDFLKDAELNIYSDLQFDRIKYSDLTDNKNIF